MKEYVERLNVAQAHFDWAVECEDVDVAIHELQAAEIALSYYVRRKRKEEEENGRIMERHTGV